VTTGVRYCYPVNGHPATEYLLILILGRAFDKNHAQRFWREAGYGGECIQVRFQPASVFFCNSDLLYDIPAFRFRVAHDSQVSERIAIQLLMVFP
jgi:hypothetical protein